MVTAWRLAAVAAAGIIGIPLLKKYNSSLVLPAELALTAVLLLVLLPDIENLFTEAVGLLGGTVGQGGLIGVLLKAFGILCISGIAADFCRDAGESAVANLVETGGKILAMGAAVPLLTAVVKLVTGLLNGV